MLVNPKGFNATLELNAKVIKKQKIGGWFSKERSSIDSIEQEKELLEKPVPDFGIDIPGVLKLGAIMSYSIGYSTSFIGSASLVFGVTASLPDDATIMVDILDRDQSYSRGFDGELVPIFDVTELTASVQFAVFTQAKLAFGLEIPNLDKQDIELVLKIPKLTYTVTAGYGKLVLDPLVMKGLFRSPFCSHRGKWFLQRGCPCFADRRKSHQSCEHRALARDRSQVWEGVDQKEGGGSPLLQ